MSWADADANHDPIDVLSNRISHLEHTVNTQMTELRNELGLAAAIAGGGQGATPALGDLEEQLARAVTVSLSAALEAIRESLTKAVADAVAQLAARPAQWAGPDLEEVAASLQHSVLLALSSFEQAYLAPPVSDPIDGPATGRDVALINQRIDELRSLLLG